MPAAIVTSTASVEPSAHSEVKHTTCYMCACRCGIRVHLRGGEVRFFKDGYTDVRGRFDYASLSTSDLDRVERFALLVMSDQHGALIREAAPPQR